MTVAFANLILLSLNSYEVARFLETASLVRLPRGALLLDVDQTVEWVYFPESGRISELLFAPDGRSAEVGSIGKEGALGYLQVCGCGVSAARCVVHDAGHAWRMGAQHCLALADRSPNFRRAIAEDMDAQSRRSRALILCTAVHNVRGRLASYLLRHMSEINHVTMTQDDLAASLGVQRTTITAEMAHFQAAKAITVGRGVIRILDGRELWKMACACRPSLAPVYESNSPEGRIDARHKLARRREARSLSDLRGKSAARRG